MTGASTGTTESLLREGVERLRLAGSESARLDAELLIADALGVRRTVVLAHPEAPVDVEAIARYRAGLLSKVDTVVTEKKAEAKLVEKANYKSTYASRYFYVIALPKGTDANQVKIKFSDLNMAGHALEGLEGRLLGLNEYYQLYRISEFKDKPSLLAEWILMHFG